MSIQHNKRLLQLVFYMFAFCFYTSYIEAITLYSRQDPVPLFSTLDPHTFIYRRYRQELLQHELDEQRACDFFHLGISPFGQNANEGKNNCLERVELGDLNGRWFMIGLLYGPVPAGRTLPPSLVAARAALFPGVVGVINDCNGFDPKQLMGFFSVPLTYRKRGIRFQLEAQLTPTIGVRVETGLADIYQSVCPSYICPCPPEVTADPPTVSTQDPDVHCAAVCATYINETDKPTNLPNPRPNLPQVNVDNVNKYLMCPFKCIIAPEICLNIDNYHKLSVEDIRAGVYWRHAYLINDTRLGWPEFLFVPFAMAEASFAISKKIPGNEVYGVSAGNNGHNALGLSAGMDGEFANSIEIGFNAGYTHFFKKGVRCMPVPTSCFQQGIYPFTTDVSVAPGANWDFGAKMSAYHFLERLSFFFQYVLVIHENDSIKLKQCDSTFQPHLLEQKSSFKTQVANVGFNYDVSPNISLGFLWQAPLQQQRSYRSTTIMFGFNATF